MLDNQRGLATILGLLFVMLMIGAMAVGIELIKSPTSFPSKASDAVNAVNIFQEPIPTPSPALTEPSPSPSPTPQTEKPSQFVVAIKKGPYLGQQKQQCFDISAVHTKFAGNSSACTPLAAKVAFDNELFPEIPKTLTNSDAEGEGCFYTGTFCKNLPDGEHTFRVTVVSNVTNNESGEFSLHYTYPPKK